jgi:hypothetical protein
LGWNGLGFDGGNNSPDWSVNGNSNTVATTHFLGTTNNQSLVIKTNNTEKVRINATGEVGIGTSTPGFPLSFANILGDKISLYSNLGNSYGMGIQSSLFQIHTTTSTSDIAFGYGSSAVFTENMRIKGNGNVGIGTASPNYKLQVLSNTFMPTVQIQNMANNGYSGIHFYDDLNAQKGHVGYANTTAPSYAGMFYAGSIAAVPFAFSTSDIERMRITPTGEVAIGTTTPNAKVEIYSNSGTGYGNLRLTENQYDYARMGLYNQSTTKFWEIAAISDNNDSLSTFNIYNSSSGNIVTIKGNKNIGISNTAPPCPLSFENITGPKISLYGSLASNYGLGVQSNLFQVYSSASTSDIAFGYGTSAAFTENVRMKGNGKVGILTNNPQAELEVNGYTKLGTNAPAMKVLKLTGTSAIAQGGSVNIPHGLVAAKILSVSVTLEYVINGFIPSSYTLNPGYEFYFYYGGTNITVVNMAANSANILSKPIKILITYEQ